jgi:hypothetical protein
MSFSEGLMVMGLIFWPIAFLIIFINEYFERQRSIDEFQSKLDEFKARAK